MTETTAISPGIAAKLVESHRQFLSFLERRLNDRALAEDILQDAFLKTIEKESEIRDDDSAVAWFYRLLRNSVIDHYRRSGVKNKALELLAGQMKDAFEPPAELRDAICACVTTLANTLKPEYADAIRRVEVEGAAVQTFAEALALANDSPYGLTACIHTRSLDRALAFVERVEAGVAVVNAGTWHE